MKQIPTLAKDAFGYPEVIYITKAGDNFWMEIPNQSALLSRDNVEQLIAELESLLRED